MSALGGLPPQRPDQIHTPRGPALGAGPRSTTFPILIVKGSRAGVFIYNAAGQLVASMAFLANVDPITRSNKAGITSYTAGGGLFSQLVQGFLELGSNAPGTTILQSGIVRATDAFAAGDTPSVIAVSPSSNIAAGVSSIHLLGESQDGTNQPQIVLAPTFAAPPTTKAAIEVQGSFQAGDGVSIGQGLGFQALVNGSTINTAGITQRPVTAAASVTGIILQAGTFDGQFISLPSDAGAGVTITFAAAATSHVKTGVGTVIQPGSCLDLRWVAATSLWYPVQ